MGGIAGHPIRFCPRKRSAEYPILYGFAALIGVGSSSTLRWTTAGDVEVARLDPLGIDVTGLSSMVVSPVSTTTYTLHLSNSLASTSGSVQVETLPVSGRIDSLYCDTGFDHAARIGSTKRNF